MNKYANHIEALNAAFADMDAEYVAGMQAWAVARREAIKAYRADNVNKRRAMGERAYYEGLFAVAGGKTWFQTFDGRSADDVARVVANKCKMIAKARNEKLAGKLVAKNIPASALVNLKFGRTSDGFHGTFVFDGATVTINTIIAGGYNIQCLHQRTLINVK